MSATLTDDRVARALGAGDTITVGEKTYTLSPIVIKHLAELERRALKHYKRDCLEALTENSDLLSREFVDRESTKIVRYTLNDLPQVPSYDVGSEGLGTLSADENPIFIPNPKIETWIRESLGSELELDSESYVQGILNNCLDGKMLTPSEAKELTGKNPQVVNIRYDQWWVTGCLEGRSQFVYQSLRGSHPKISSDEVLSWSRLKLLEATTTVSNLTAAALGNM